MPWSGNIDSISQSTPRNYMYGPFVFLLDEISQSTCFALIGDLTNYVMTEDKTGDKVLNIIINSPGGDVSTMTTILGLINIAKLNNILVRSYVLGTAASAASMIAIQADERYMTNLSQHFIHFGTVVSVTSKESEIEKIYLQTKEHSKTVQDLYIEASEGKLTQRMLEEIQKDERGYLSAKDCVRFGLCDKIIEADLYDMINERKKKDEQISAFIKYQNEQKKKSKTSKEKKGKK